MRGTGGHDDHVRGCVQNLADAACASTRIKGPNGQSGAVANRFQSQQAQCHSELATPPAPRELVWKELGFRSDSAGDDSAMHLAPFRSWYGIATVIRRFRSYWYGGGIADRGT